MNRIKATVKNNYQNSDIEKEILNLICFRFSRNNLVVLLNKYGPDFMLDFLDSFSGCYFRIPSGGKIFNVLDLYRLYFLNREARRAHDAKNRVDWEMYERAFLVQCKKMHIRYATGRGLIRPVAREVAKANEWRKEMMTLTARQDKKEL